jgi:murein L,D-transpeptidase YafK
VRRHGAENQHHSVKLKPILLLTALWAAGLICAAASPRPVPVRVVVEKTRRRLEVYSGTKLLHAYPIALGLDPVNDKVREGDRRTPEGTFYVTGRNEKSRFYMSLLLSYPNAEDARRGLRDRLIARRDYRRITGALRRHATPPQNTPLGGYVMIHGGGTQRDWTWGCIALENPDIRELCHLVRRGTPVIIRH